MLPWENDSLGRKFSSGFDNCVDDLNREPGHWASGSASPKDDHDYNSFNMCSHAFIHAGAVSE